MLLVGAGTHGQWSPEYNVFEDLASRALYRSSTMIPLKRVVVHEVLEGQMLRFGLLVLQHNVLHSSLVKQMTIFSPMCSQCNSTSRAIHRSSSD